MKISNSVEKLFKSYIPTSFTIAVILTFITLLFALALTNSDNNPKYFFEICSYWEKGVWDSSLLVFAYQMILILVLGHILALSSPFENLIKKITNNINSSSKAVLILSFSAILAAFFNWGLGLIFGAILARKIGEHCNKNKISFNYPLLGAAGYVGLMIWHGGISGSAPIKVSEKNHIYNLMSGISSPENLTKLPININFSETVLSTANLTTYLILIILVPLSFWIINKFIKTSKFEFDSINQNIKLNINQNNSENLKIDSSKIMGLIFGCFIIFSFAINYGEQVLLFQITPNALNLLMLGVGIILHKNFQSFLSALKIAVGGASGILIQFPLYFGIMGIMKDSGLIILMSDFFISISTETTLPIFTFLSAGFVNIFVPSGGGQWAIQGPIIIEAALNLKVPLNKIVMALAYGDQLTNMLQPFWALPLLAITGLKAKDILPYSLIIMVLGAIIFIGSLIIF